MGTSRHNVRRYIRAARNQRGWTQAELAGAAHLTRNTVIAIEGGTRVSEDSETAVEVALGLPVGSVERARRGMPVTLPNGDAFTPIPDAAQDPASEPGITLDDVRKRLEALQEEHSELLAMIGRLERQEKRKAR